MAILNLVGGEASKDLRYMSGSGTTNSSGMLTINVGFRPWSMVYRLTPSSGSNSYMGICRTGDAYYPHSYAANWLKILVNWAVDPDAAPGTSSSNIGFFQSTSQQPHVLSGYSSDGATYATLNTSTTLTLYLRNKSGNAMTGYTVNYNITGFAPI